MCVSAGGAGRLLAWPRGALVHPLGRTAVLALCSPSPPHNSCSIVPRRTAAQATAGRRLHAQRARPPLWGQRQREQRGGGAVGLKRTALLCAAGKQWLERYRLRGLNALLFRPVILVSVEYVLLFSVHILLCAMATMTGMHVHIQYVYRFDVS